MRARGDLELERRGKLHALITRTSTDAPEAGNSPERVIEVHGTVHACCPLMRLEGAMQETLARVRAENPTRPASVAADLKKRYHLVRAGTRTEVIDRAMQAATEADLLIRFGTSLRVYPIAGAVPAAEECGPRS